ncbi:hypothetical protein EI555_005466, partial [Monodon monoceros]
AFAVTTSQCIRIPEPAAGRGHQGVAAKPVRPEVTVLETFAPRALSSKELGRGAQLCRAFPEALLSPANPDSLGSGWGEPSGRCVALLNPTPTPSRVPRKPGPWEEARQAGPRTQARRGQQEHLLPQSSS